ncbi:MAG: chemotaxis protein CheW [Gammaproteobacteria bacterium]
MTIGADQRDTSLVMGAYFDALLREDVPCAAPESVAENAIVNVSPGAPSSPSSPPLTAASPAAAAGSYQMIRVSGMTLGVPTAAIDNIVALDSITVTAITASDCSSGYYTEGATRIAIVETARLLLPDHATRPSPQTRFLVRLKNQPWALSCEAVDATFTPAPDAVNWRGTHGKRLWLAGTVRDPGCALLDIPELLKLLAS